MTPIDLSKSLVGELYPLSANAAKIGKFGFDYRYPTFPLGDIGNATTIFTVPGQQPDFKWRITPLRYDEVLISCTHPKTQKTFLMGCTKVDRNQTYACVVESPIPEHCEQVRDRFLFNVRYVEGS